VRASSDGVPVQKVDTPMPLDQAPVPPDGLSAPPDQLLMPLDELSGSSDGDFVRTERLGVY
jgi:hypothetical protein